MVIVCERVEERKQRVFAAGDEGDDLQRSGHGYWQKASRGFAFSIFSSTRGLSD